jgi:23S rRNA-/tRNA-specific pseudouridylate synthase
MIRLQKILSQAGVASRRAAEKLIAEGRVSVNGRTVSEMGVKADPAADDIRVDGRRVKSPERLRYILLNKPKGYVTTRSDPERRRTVIDLLGGVREYVYPVGRLDYDSEGLLLLTNDGDLAARLTHPRHGVERTYEARVAGTPTKKPWPACARGFLSTAIARSSDGGPRSATAPRRRCGVVADDSRGTQSSSAPDVRSRQPSGENAEANARGSDQRSQAATRRVAGVEGGRSRGSEESRPAEGIR